MSPRIALLLSAVALITGLVDMVLELGSSWRYWTLILFGISYSFIIIWKIILAGKASHVIFMAWILPIILESFKNRENAVISHEQFMDLAGSMSIFIIKTATRSHYESLIGYWSLSIAFSMTPEKLQSTIANMEEVEKYITDEEVDEYIFTDEEVGNMIVAASAAVTNFLIAAESGTVKVPFFAR